MPEPRYIQVAPKVEELYWQKTADEITNELGIGGSTYARAKEYAGLPPKTNKNRLEHVYGVPAEWLLDTLHNTLGKSVNQMSDDLPVSRKWISNKMDEWGLPRRGQSEAELHKWKQMSPEEREAQISAAHKANFEKYGDGGHIGKWVSENPDEHQAVAEQAAPLGTPARETNGMAGMTGQDNPNWRGGKSILDAVRKQLPGKSWRQKKVEAKRRDGYFCQKCGAVGIKMDSHHLVPVMAGGCHADELLMTLCESCHRKAEAFVRRYEEFDPVLVQ